MAQRLVMEIKMPQTNHCRGLASKEIDSVFFRPKLLFRYVEVYWKNFTQFFAIFAIFVIFDATHRPPAGTQFIWYKGD